MASESNDHQTSDDYFESVSEGDGDYKVPLQPITLPSVCPPPGSEPSALTHRRPVGQVVSAGNVDLSGLPLPPHHIAEERLPMAGVDFPISDTATNVVGNFRLIRKWYDAVRADPTDSSAKFGVDPLRVVSDVATSEFTVSTSDGVATSSASIEQGHGPNNLRDMSLSLLQNLCRSRECVRPPRRLPVTDQTVNAPFHAQVGIADLEPVPPPASAATSVSSPSTSSPDTDIRSPGLAHLPALYSKLTVQVEDFTMEFELHEVVYFAEEMLRQEPVVMYPLVDDTKHDQLYWDLAFAEYSDNDIHIKAEKQASDAGSNLFSALCLPLCTTVGSTPLTLQSIAHQLAMSEPYRDQSTSNAGWWFNLAGRLLHIKNEASFRFYVSDYGYIGELIPWLENVIFSSAPQCDWVLNPDVYIEGNKHPLWSSFVKDETQNLRYYHHIVHYISECLLVILGLIMNDPSADTEFWDADVVPCDYGDEKHEAEVDLDDIDSTFPACPKLVKDMDTSDNKIHAATRLRRMILSIAAFGFNKGHNKLFFRSLNAYGSEDGESYMKFETAIRRFQQLHPMQSADYIAERMRSILLNRTPPMRNSDPHSPQDFLYALTVAWFIAEPARYPLALLSGLALLDLIESKVTLCDTNPFCGENFDWYSWSCALIHPFKHLSDMRDGSGRSFPSKVRDMYGDPVKIDSFGGMHPMAHSGSVRDTATELQSGQKLSVAKQKAGSLLIDWLHRFLQHHIPPDGIKVFSSVDTVFRVTASAQTVTNAPLNPKPSYDRIQNLEKRLFKKSNKSKRYSSVNRHTEELTTIQKTNRIMQLLQNVLRSRLFSHENQLSMPLQLLRSFCFNHSERIFHPDPSQGPSSFRDFDMIHPEAEGKVNGSFDQEREGNKRQKHQPKEGGGGKGEQ